MSDKKGLLTPTELLLLMLHISSGEYTTVFQIGRIGANCSKSENCYSTYIKSHCNTERTICCWKWQSLQINQSWSTTCCSSSLHTHAHTHSKRGELCQMARGPNNPWLILHRHMHDHHFVGTFHLVSCQIRCYFERHTYCNPGGADSVCLYTLM